MIYSILIFLIGCNYKIDRNKSFFKSSIQEKDSIFSIVNKLCGTWEIDSKIGKEFSSKGIFLSDMIIFCSFKMDNIELLNELHIVNHQLIRMKHTEMSDSIENLFLPKSDSVIISRKDNIYGFESYNKEGSKFIGIETLNDSILNLVDGRKFIRSK